MALEGDWKKLTAMIGELQSVRGLMGPVTRVAHGRVSSLWDSGFTSQKDPWGNSWDPTAEGKSPVLVATGDLANAAITSSRGVVRVKPPRYWIFHQTGANNMKERAVLPFGHSNWSAPIERAIRDIVYWHFKSREAD